MNRRSVKTRVLTYCHNLNRNHRAVTRNEERRILRLRSFGTNRGLNIVVDKTEAATRVPKMRLSRWKKEKELRKMMTKKPPFKCVTAIKYNDSALYRNIDIPAKNAVPKVREQKPLAPAGFVFKPPKGVVPMPWQLRQTPRQTPRPVTIFDVFPRPTTSKLNNMLKGKLGNLPNSEPSRVGNFVRTRLFPAGTPKGSNTENKFERPKTRALTRLEDANQRPPWKR